MKVQHNPNQNQLLAALPAVDLRRLSEHLELVPMPLGESYYESGGKLQHVYFPTTSIVSLSYAMEGGASAEIASVGKEGMLGVSTFMGDKALPKRAFVRTVGYGYRLKARLLLEEFNRTEAMQHLLLRYTKALITQASQTVVCNRYHTLEQKLCRWLLSNHDRVPSSDASVTQDLLAGSLGVRREAIAEPLKKLRQAGFVRYLCGQVAVLDRAALEGQTCECYKAIKAVQESLYGQHFLKPAPESAKTWSIASNAAGAPRLLFGAS